MYNKTMKKIEMLKFKAASLEKFFKVSHYLHVSLSHTQYLKSLHSPFDLLSEKLRRRVTCEEVEEEKLREEVCPL